MFSGDLAFLFHIAIYFIARLNIFCANCGFLMGAHS